MKTFLLFFILTSHLHASDITVVKPPRAASPDLKMKASKVPQFELIKKRKLPNGKMETVRVTSIPKLNLGEESVLKANQLKAQSLPSVPEAVQLQGLKLPTPVLDIQIETLIKSTQTLAPVSSPESIMKALKSKATPASDISLPVLDPFKKPTFVFTEPVTKTLKPLSPTEQKMLLGIILEERAGQPSLALAAFTDLKKDPSVQSEATLHMGTSALQLGLHSEFKFNMLQLIDAGKEPWNSMAIALLLKNAKPNDTEIVGSIDGKLSGLQVKPVISEQYRLNQALFYIEKNDLDSALAALDSIKPENSLYYESLFLRGLILYKSSDLENSLKWLTQAMNYFWNEKKTSEFRSITALTLARLYFQLGKYKESFDTYLKVDKRNPEWLQAMIEQAWSQILARDYEGAAGNMFSLHTEFLKDQFTPESYVVRTVAYLNLCQFGDGAMVVKQLQKKYAPYFELIKKFKDSNQTPDSYYNLIRDWAKDPSQNIVGGLPSQLIYAMTKNPGFQTNQNSINSIEDESNIINQISLNLIKNERELIKKISDAKVLLLDAKPEAESTLQLKKDLSSYQSQYDALKNARKSIKPMRDDLQNRLNQEKSRLKVKAGEALRAGFNRQFSTLQNTLDQVDVLKYELYSGAGEHIRYQVAGGEANDAKRPELKVEDSKAMKWDFRGEVWEDEIGHYRSGLKNVCPPEESTQPEEP